MEFFRSFVDPGNTWILHSKKEYRLTFYDDRYDHTKCLSKTWKDNVKEVTIQSIERKIQIQKKLKKISGCIFEIEFHSFSFDSAVEESQTEPILSSAHVEQPNDCEADIIQNYVPLVAQMANCIIE